MVVNQVTFIILAYDLLQIYLLHQGRKELNQKTLPRIRQQLLPSDNHIIVYWQNYYGLFEPFELIGFVVMLGEEARKKIAAKCRRILPDFRSGESCLFMHSCFSAPSRTLRRRKLNRDTG